MNSQVAAFKYDNPDPATNTTVTRQYDAENHLTQTYMNSLQASYPKAAIAWGPNGHPILIGTYDNSPSQTLHNEVLHWDGDQLLFTTRGGSGALDDVKIDVQGDLLPQDNGYSGLTFYDRGPAGVVMGCHNATGSSYAGVGDTWGITFFRNEAGTFTSPCLQNATGQEPTSIDWFGSPYNSSLSSKTTIGGSIGQGGTLGMPRTDGLTDDFDTIQGVRAFDNTAGAWTTPDAYAGDVRDPMSQKSYMWNGNNPIAYQDPSGYLPTDEEGEELPETESPSFEIANTRALATQIVSQNIPEQEVQRIIENPNTPPDARAAFQTSVPLKGATYVRNTSSNTAIYTKSGGEEEAQDDFNSMKLNGVQTYANGTTVGRLATGQTVNVHYSPDDHQYVIEIQFSKSSSVKVRYMEPQKPR